MSSNGIHRKKDSARIVWDSKPRRAPNPKDIEFQTAEVVIPNPETAGQLPLTFADKLFGEEEPDKQKMNRLIWGDNLLAMQALLHQGYEGKINLIYIDPPFDSKADYSHKIKLGETEFTKEPSVIERLAYKDTWAGGTDSYLDMLYPRLQLMKRLLAPDGSIYVHLDWHVGHYVKVMMDEIFDKHNFINEIVWWYKRWTATSNKFQRMHDTIFFYGRSDKYKFNQLFQPLAESTKKVHGDTKRINIFDEEGRMVTKKTEEKSVGVQMHDVWEIPFVVEHSQEQSGYDTQKPIELLGRIIDASTNEGDLVADFFIGSGTTALAAEGWRSKKEGDKTIYYNNSKPRRWLGCDLGKVSIQAARAQLVKYDARPFLIENIGNYQREMIYLGGARIYEMQKIILKLYGAEPMANRKDLGVRKTEDGTLELVYCGYPDRAVAAHKVEDLAIEAATLDGTGYKRLVILAWDYEYNYDELLQTRIKAAGKDLKTEIVSRQIPPDIYEYLKQAKSEQDIERLLEKVKFLEKPYLKLKKPEVKGNSVTIGIEKYVLYDFPLGSGKKSDEDREELMRLVKDNFAVLIDYWAVDWDYDGLTFKSQWQDLRGLGRKTKVVKTEKEHTYEKTGKHTIAVRVVDIFGNDATATVDIKA